MRSVRDIITARMAVVHVKTVRQLADRLDVDESHVSKYMRGDRPIPIDQVDTWVDALQLAGDDAREFNLAVRIDHADELVRAYVHQLQATVEEKRLMLEIFDERLALLTEIVSQIRSLLHSGPSADPEGEAR